MVGDTGDQVSEVGIAVTFFFAIFVEVHNAMLGRQKKPRVDEAGSAKALLSKTSLDVDPRDEGEILNATDKFAANDLKLSPAAHTVRLLLALETSQLGGELGPLGRKARQGIQLCFLLQEPGAVDPLPALPSLLAFTCTEITEQTFCRLFTTDLQRAGQKMSRPIQRGKSIHRSAAARRKKPFLEAFPLQTDWLHGHSSPGLFVHG